jgi:hypothetical protein
MQQLRAVPFTGHDGTIKGWLIQTLLSLFKKKNV